MLNQLGEQLARAEYKDTSRTANHLVLALVFVWALSGWIVAHELSPAWADAADNTHQTVVYIYE